MADPHGSFIWYELLTTDLEAAAAFYGTVLGWNVQPSGQPGIDYRFFRAGTTGIAGFMKLPEKATSSGVPSTWLGYIGVDDVDSAVASIVAKGGVVHMPAQNIPGIGRFAMLSDPQGVSFYVMRGESDQPSTSFAPNLPGHAGWHELHAKNAQAAFSFYAEQFQWTQVDALDMGPMGTYRVFARSTGDAIGGMMDSPNFPRPSWLYYFNVDDIDAAHERLTGHGGKVLHGPAQVPGGGFIIQALDPQGALFAISGPRKT